MNTYYFDWGSHYQAEDEEVTVMAINQTTPERWQDKIEIYGTDREEVDKLRDHIIKLLRQHPFRY